MIARRGLWGAAALALFVVAWWAVFFVGHGERPDLDVLLYFYPLYAATWARIAEGVLPLWNPYQLCGLPWLGTLQAGLFYPTHVLYAVLPLPTALAASSALHLAVMAVATAIFVRRLGLGSAAAVLAAVVFTLRGRVAYSLVAPNFIEAVVWLPIGAVALVDLVRAPSGRATALLAIATGASFLAGYPQTSVYVVYTWASLVVALLVHEGIRPRDWPVRVAAVAAGLALGAGVAAVQMLPALELARLGTRAAGELAERAMLPFGAELTPALPVLAKQTITEAPLAFGAVVLGLVPAALAVGGRRALGAWALGVGALAAIWSLGRFTPLFDLYLLLPAVSWFRNPSRLLFVLDFCMAIAAALGLAALRGRDEGAAGPGRREAWLVAIVVGAGLLAVVAGIRDGWVLEGRGAMGMGFAVLTATGVAALPWVGPAGRRRVAVLLVAAATVEISQNPWGGVRLPYATADVAPYRTLAREFEALAVRAGHDRVWQALAGLSSETALKLSTWYRLRSIVDYEPINLARQSEYFTYLTEGSTTALRAPWLFAGDIPTVTAPPGIPAVANRRRLLDLAAVRWIVFRRGAPLAPEIATFIRDAGLVRQPGGQWLIVFANPAALPRAFVTYRARTAPASAEALLAMISHRAFDPLAESYVEGPVPFEAAPDAPRGHALAFVRDDETVVELDVRLERPGLVVLSDSFYPGWHATVDGRAVPIVATNHLFRGVPAPAGAHRVRFVYSPASVWTGAVVSLTALAAIGWLVLRPRLGQRRDAQPGGEASAAT